MVLVERRRRRSTFRRARLALRYVARLLREFRVTALALAFVVLAGAATYALAPPSAFAGPTPTFATWPLLAAWMNLFGEALVQPATWYVGLLLGVLPLAGFVLVGEGVVRLGILTFSRTRREKEWMTLMASTFRDHIILCGLGHLGFRVLNQLLDRQQDVVVIERDPACQFLQRAKDRGAAVLLLDMRDDRSLEAAGLQAAQAIVVASNDDLANIEVALDARRLNPRIKVLLRLFDQRIADKFKDAGFIDEAFSSTALAAPAVVEMTMRVAGKPP
jgi:voltage-gated potassium channel